MSDLKKYINNLITVVNDIEPYASILNCEKFKVNILKYSSKSTIIFLKLHFLVFNVFVNV